MNPEACIAALPDPRPSKPRIPAFGSKILGKVRRAPHTICRLIYWRWQATLRRFPNVVEFYYRYNPFPQRTAIPTPLGFKMSGGNSAHHRVMMNGEFERDEVREVQSLMDEVDVFVDVGANIGYYSLLARQKNKYVIAVEPLAANFQFLCRNFVANGWEDAEAYPMGLGRKPGIAVLYGLSSTGASMLAGWAGAPHRWRQTIPVTTLDGILGNRFAEKNILIKIDVEGVEYDVEGVEYDVLRGADTVLARSRRPTFMVEICLGEFNPGGKNPNFRDTFRLFWEHGYEARLMGGGNRPVTSADVERWVRIGRTDTGVINYLFTPVTRQVVNMRP